MNDHFNAAALILRLHVSDAPSLFAAASDIAGLIETEVAKAAQQAESRSPEPLPHFVLVRIAKGNRDVMEEVKRGQKAAAISALCDLGARALLPSVISFKAAKEAIEDPEVMAFFGLDANAPWNDPSFS